MKHIVMTFLLLCAFCAGLQAQQKVSFAFQDGLNNQQLKAQMEASISALLTEINDACAQNRALQLDKFNMSDRARRSLTRLWENYARLECTFNQNISSCIRSVTGFEVRQIYVKLYPVDPVSFNDEYYRELTIGFDSDGSINSICLALENNTLVPSEANDVTDVRRREEILKFVEDFRSYYDAKDWDALNNIYSDDALIITGKVVMRKAMGDGQARLRPEIVYDKKTKAEYMASLRNVFRNNSYIRLKFDDIEVVKHGAKENFYGVTLHQNWNSSSYIDDGYVFLLWQFFDDPDKHPIIHVRTWQPEKLGNDQLLSRDDVFNYNDFFIGD